MCVVTVLYQDKFVLQIPNHLFQLTPTPNLVHMYAIENSVVYS